MGQRSPKDLTKAHGNIRRMKEWDGPRMAQGMKQVEDAQRNKMGQGCPKWYENWPNRNTGQRKLRGKVIHGTGRASPNEAHQTQVKQYHGKSNVMAWQEYQMAHKQEVKGDKG